jgi:16S rRNA (cytidine1402-2'-O)-methyltransferase
MALHLIPTPIAEGKLSFVDDHLKQLITNIKIWCVEELRTARRFLKAVNREIDIDACTFYVVNEHGSDLLEEVTKHMLAKAEIGLLTEAGLPAIADPGSNVVALAHKHKLQVVPYIGPSSLMMALMASGCNGNQFAYNGYLPAKNPDRINAIKKLANQVQGNGSTQIFIEAPYRNNQMLQDLITHLPGHMQLCIACNLMCDDEIIISKAASQWKFVQVDLHKKPTVFVVGSTQE